jgi:hypothetical protein
MTSFRSQGTWRGAMAEAVSLVLLRRRALSCREAGEPAPTAHEPELGVLCAAHDRSAQRLTRTESAISACYASVTSPAWSPAVAGIPGQQEGEHSVPLALPGCSWRPGNLAELGIPVSHRIPTSPVHGGGSPQNPHGQDGIPRHTTARMLICHHYP